ncbi:MAG: response regulator [Gemmatimonadetes bacterium]|nr:response regulator [Gemmatimonadota bacterium]
MNGKTVLIVDDHGPTREAYAELLTDCGFEVIQAAHGGEAILHVHRHCPDAVLMDIAMPVLDGVETAESLRRCALTAGIRILAITGSGSTRDRERMQALCDDLLSKPCTPAEVVSRIRSLVTIAA